MNALAVGLNEEVWLQYSAKMGYFRVPAGTKPSHAHPIAPQLATPETLERWERAGRPTVPWFYRPELAPRPLTDEQAELLRWWEQVREWML